MASPREGIKAGRGGKRARCGVATAIGGGPGIMHDPDDIDFAGVVAAHEAGHVMRLEHPVVGNSPLLIAGEEFRNVMHSGPVFPDTIAEDLLRRQGELARFSTLVKEDF
jgi:hypothetical protein